MATKRYELTAHVYSKNGKLLAIGHNSYTKTHPLQKYFAEKVGHNHCIYLHAEIAALLKCKTKNPHTMYIYRYGTNNEYRNSEPCPICKEALKAFGIKTVYYSSSNQQMLELKL